MPHRPEVHRWYTTASWLRRRRHQLRIQPLCELCLAAGRVEPATAADLIESHGGENSAFRLGPLRSLCKACHDRLDRNNAPRSPVRVDGTPSDPDHPGIKAELERCGRLRVGKKNLYLQRWSEHTWPISEVSARLVEVKGHITVLKGTWYAGTGDKFDPEHAVPLKPGSYMMHPTKAVHWDGSAGDEEVIGYGPSGTTRRSWSAVLA